MRRVQISCDICSRAFYYMEKSVLLGTKPLVDSIRHFIRDPSGVFSVCHLCECRIVQWRHDSRLLLLLNWFLASHLVSLHIIKRITRSLTREILFLPLERKIHIFSPPCNILYICTLRGSMGKKGQLLPYRWRVRNFWSYKLCYTRLPIMSYTCGIGVKQMFSWPADVMTANWSTLRAHA